MSRPKPSGRSYGRLTRHERNTVERMLDRNRSAREIAAELGRSPSTVTREVAAHRYVTAPRSRYGEPAPADLSGPCPRLSAWPRCCNGCSHRRGYGCSRRPRVFYSARRAQEAADAELSASRSGIDETEAGAAATLAALRDGLARGRSPQQIAATTPGLSASTVYRWVDAGYDGMTNMELRRKVGYRPRSRRAPKGATSHSARRSHASFLALGEDACAAAWEMDTVEGSRGDSARLLTLLHRPSRFQLALPLPDGTRRAFGAVLTDNGSEFADEGAIAALLGERDGETRLFYCDPRQSQQKGACEKNHVEIRKLLPKGAGARFDRLTAADCALLMSQVNSEPRGALGFLTPARVLRMALGGDASALMDAFGIEELAPGELDLTPGCIERARAARGEGPLAG